MALDKNKTILAAQKFIQKGMYERAIKELASIVREDPRDIKVRQKLGDLYARENKKTEALAEYNYVARFYADDGFYLRAIALYKQVLKLDPTQITINLKLAELYHKQNLNGDAIQQFQLVYQYYERKGDTVRALETLGKMAEMAPGNLKLRMALADAYYRNGYIDHSLDEYVKIGEQLKKEDRTDDMVNLYEKLIKHHPQRLDMITEVADAYLRDNKKEMAEARIDMGLAAASDNMKLLYLKSRLALERTDHRASIEILERILRIDPEFLQAKEDLAKVYERLGNKEMLEKIYTELMISFRKKVGGEEKSAHYKALYDNLKSTISEDMMGAGVDRSALSTVDDEMGEPEIGESELGESELGEAEMGEAEVIEVGDDDIIEAQVIAEEPEGDEGDQEIQESLDNEGRLVMLKVDTYVKYGQFKEAANVLSEYAQKNDFITPKMRLAELFGELADKADDPRQYKKRAAQEYLAISAIAKREGKGALAKRMRARAGKLDPDAGFAESPAPVTEAPERFDVVLDETEELGVVGDEGDFSSVEDFSSTDEIEVSDSIDVGAMGTEPIEISLAESEVSEGYETVIEDDQLHEVKPTREIRSGDAQTSGLINMAPGDEPLPDGEDYFDLRKELEEVVLDEDMSLESVGGAGLLGKDDQYSFEDVFEEFKRGVQKEFGKEDYDTHYNLGIAYREMELFDDAIAEFLISAKDPKKMLDSYVMLGVTHRDIGDLGKSIDYFSEAAETPGVKGDERLGILYELALSLEMSRNIGEAYSLYETIYGHNPSFRDVAEKVKALGPAAGTAPAKERAPQEEKRPTPPTTPKKGKISFV
jgi:tetratricopeptide (TPR) repeat protein